MAPQYENSLSLPAEMHEHLSELWFHEGRFRFVLEARHVALAVSLGAEEDHVRWNHSAMSAPANAPLMRPYAEAYRWAEFEAQQRLYMVG